MKTAQLQFAAGKWMVDQVPANFPTDKAQLVLVFGSGELVTQLSLFNDSCCFYWNNNTIKILLLLKIHFIIV